jgi:DNA-binding transcriptional MerR regulator
MSTNGHAVITSGKSFFRIGEVSRLTDTKPFVLRYWESEFPMLQPVKSPKGHRLYRREDVETVLLIKRLLRDEGFTIAGARRHLRETNGAPPEGGPAAVHSSENQFHEEHRGEASSPREAGQARASSFAGGSHAPAQPAISRKVLLDLRDSLRAFLTLLESE